MIDRTAAEQAIGALFAQYKSQVTAADQAVMQALSDGKLYELFVLAEVVRELDARGVFDAFAQSLDVVHRRIVHG